MADESGTDQDAPKESMDESSFEALEKNFENVLAELMADDALERFRGEYEKLHGSLKKSRDNERRLMVKCRELKAEIVSNASKLTEVMRLSQDDNSNLTALKAEIDKAWKLVDIGTEKEAQAKETIQRLQDEIGELSNLVDDKEVLGDEYSVQDLVNLKDSLTIERDQAMAAIVTLRSELTETIGKHKAEETAREEAEHSNVQLREEIQQSNHELQREQHRKGKLEKEVAAIRQEVEMRRDELALATESSESMRENIAIMEENIRDVESQNDRARIMLETQRAHSNGIQQKLEDQIETAERLSRDCAEQTQVLKAKDEEIRALKQEQTRTRQLRDNLNAKLLQAEKEKGELERQKDDIKAQIAGLERELGQQRQSTDLKGRKCDELTRERDKLDRKMRKQMGQTQHQSDVAKMHMQSQLHLEQEIANFEEEATKQRKIISALERERDSYYEEIGDKAQRCNDLAETLKVKEILIIDLKKQITDAEARRKQQQNLYEAVRSDRNMYSKNLMEKQDELGEMRKKLGNTQRLIEQLKDDIAGKEATLVQEHAEHQKLEKDKETLRAEVSRVKSELNEAARFANDQQKEHGKLQRLMQESEAERLRQKKELDQVVNERDILGSQIVRRNDELELLHEKIKILRCTLEKGEGQYAQRLEDIRILKLEIKRVRRQRAVLSKNVDSLTDLKREVFTVQKDLMRERMRCQTLEQELQNPLNVHRWRTLQASDPSKFQLINKVQVLQRKLITKTEEVVEKELMIKDKEKLYVELKQILARQPGPEVQQQVMMYQQTLKAKTKQLKAMAAELNMFEAQMSEAKMDTERLARELQDVKKKYFIMKRKEQQKRERETALGQSGFPPIQTATSETTQYLGGGFSMGPRPTQPARPTQPRIVQ